MRGTFALGFRAQLCARLGAQSSREFAYASVIKIWYDESAEGQTLTNYVIEQGGIENVRRTAGKQATTTLSVDEYKEIAEAAFAGGNALATFNLENYMVGDENNDTDYVVALVRSDGNGMGSVVAACNKRALVSNALAAMGKQIDELQEQEKHKNAQNDKRGTALANVQQFVAQQHSKAA